MKTAIQRMEELKAAREKATPGEWGQYKTYGAVISDLYKDTEVKVSHSEEPNDAAFIALAANEWPNLLEALTVMHEALEKYKYTYAVVNGNTEGYAADEALAKAEKIILSTKENL